MNEDRKRLTCEERIGIELAYELEQASNALEHDSYCDECYTTWESEAWRNGICKDDVCPRCGSEDVEIGNSSAAREQWEEGILEISPLHTVYRVGLSCGGPADGFYIHVDPEDRQIINIEYYFQNWFDGATRPVRGSGFDALCSLLQPLIGLQDE